VATDAQGVPLHVSILRGNRADNKTLQGLLRTLRRRFGIAEATFVFDGGMSSKINLEAMSQAHLKYVTRLSSATLQSLLSELPQDGQMQLGDREQVVEITHEGKRYVIAGGRWRQQRDEERRAARLAKAEKELKRLAAVRRKKVNAQKLASQVGRTLQRLKAHKYFVYEIDASGQLKWSRKEDLIEREEQIDGWFLLHTNQSVAECTGRQTLEHYKGLLQVEEAFCQLKDYLQVRPVFHWRPDRVVNHVRLCFLAYWISARLGKEWREKGEREEVPRILRKLQTIRVGTLQLGDKVCEKLMTEVPKDLNAQLTKLGLAGLFAAPPEGSPV
jgi:transposase